ncbi:MAG: NAD(P)/FAD-dependent oxidoreductase [Anaerolineales bacterium]
MTYPDVVIIGGGIVGCACAYYLTQAGVRVHLVERGALGSGASKAGMTHIVTWEEPEIHLRLAMKSKLLYRELSHSLPVDIQYRETGSIAIVEKPESMASFGETIQRLQKWGVKCRLLNTAELVAMEPRIAPDVGGGAYFSEDAQVNPLFATQGLAQAAQANGATIETFNEVVGIEYSHDQHRIHGVQTKKGLIPTQGIVIAAGAWSAQIAKMIQLDVPIQPRKGTLVVTVPLPQDYFSCKIILAAGYMDSVREGASSGVAVAANVQQVRNGNLILGSSRQFVGFDASVDPVVVSSMMQRNLRFFPDLKKVTAIRTWAGFRPYTPDLLPIISPVETIEGLYIAAGHEGIGITEAPVTGKLISQLITKQTPDIPLGELRLSRFNGVS